jgi:hypothetical protein
MTEAKDCRHEFVIMFQRRWTQTGKRLISRRAYLPVGFKTSDLGYLSDDAFCFCTKCRARLHPKFTRAEKEAARMAKKAQKATSTELDTAVLDYVGSELDKPIEVEELELEDEGVELVTQTGLTPPIAEEDEEEESEEY